MGKPTGFLEFERELPPKRDPKQRINDYKELYVDVADKKTNEQAARCMDCGIPFCHTGCPLGNLIPDFNDLSVLIPVFVIPIAVQWWNVWYPGAEPGGGGYIAQRMLSAKDEKNA